MILMTHSRHKSNMLIVLIFGLFCFNTSAPTKKIKTLNKQLDTGLFGLFS